MRLCRKSSVDNIKPGVLSSRALMRADPDLLLYLSAWLGSSTRVRLAGLEEL